MYVPWPVARSKPKTALRIGPGSHVHVVVASGLHWAVISAWRSHGCTLLSLLSLGMRSPGLLLAMTTDTTHIGFRSTSPKICQQGLSDAPPVYRRIDGPVPCPMPLSRASRVKLTDSPPSYCLGTLASGKQSHLGYILIYLRVRGSACSLDLAVGCASWQSAVPSLVAQLRAPDFAYLRRAAPPHVRCPAVANSRFLRWESGLHLTRLGGFAPCVFHVR